MTAAPGTEPVIDEARRRREMTWLARREREAAVRRALKVNRDRSKAITHSTKLKRGRR